MDERQWTPHRTQASIASAPFLLAKHAFDKPVYPSFRCYSSSLRPPPLDPQSGTIPPIAKGPSAAPPNSAVLGSNGTTKGVVSKAWKPSFVVLAPTFLFTHVTLAWAMVPPIYLILRSTNLSNTLLAGPQGAWFLSRKVPSWVPDTMVNSLVGGAPADRGQISQRPTVEELIERLARRGIRIIYNISRSAFSGMKGGSGEENALAKAALRELRGGLGVKEEQVRDKADGLKDKITGYTRKQAQGAVSEIKFGQIRDGVAAWVLVKVGEI